MSKPSITNCPNTFFRKVHSFNCIYSSLSCFACVQLRHTPLSGGYCGEVPPLPIPNREVKPVHADGTAVTCGRVGSRLLRVLRAFGGLFFVRILIGVVSVVVRGNELRFRTEGDCFLVSFWFFFCFFCFFCKYAFGYCYYLYYYRHIYIFIILLNVHV